MPAFDRTIPFFNYQALFVQHEHALTAIFREVGRRGDFILRQDVALFEQRLQDFLGIRHAVGLADCTNAMLLGLRALGVGPGDEVVLPSHAFVAAAQAIHYSGATPVPVELGPDRLVDPASIERAITPRTRALMPVQLNGRVCAMEEILAIAERHHLAVIEDAAQALGATYRGRFAGTFGDAGCFSFYPAKLLGCLGDGGALVTDDDDLAATVRSMRNHGTNEDRVVEIWGTNCRLDNLQAAILNAKLDHYHADLERRRAIARRYHEGLAEIEDLGLPPGPDDDPERFDCFQNYEIVSGRRDALRAHLSAHGIGTIVQWGGVPLHQMRFLGFTQELPRTDRFFERCLLLPMNQFLDDDDVAHVIATIRGFYGLGAGH
jgi:dTDP-4-amino-4,6-dideoxygalactose transaminase